MLPILTPEHLADVPGLDDLVLPALVEETVTFELRKGAGFRHTLALAGRGGTGKTQLGLAIAKELQAEQVIVINTAPTGEKWREIYAAIDEGTFILMDEIHTYGKHPEVLDLGENALGLGRKLDALWIYAATTDRGKVPQPAMSRFPVRLDLTYSPEEINRIADVISARFDIELSDEERKILVKASVGNPRTMRNILGFWAAGPKNAIRMSSLTADGLDPDAIRLLFALAKLRSGATIGEERLAGLLNASSSGGGIKDVLAVVVQLGFVEYASTGLAITPAGRHRIAPPKG